MSLELSPSTQNIEANQNMSVSSDTETLVMSNHNSAMSPDFYHYRSIYSQAEMVKFAQLSSNETITLFIEGQTGALPIIHPKRLKTEIEQKINDYAAIDSIKETKQGKILVITHSIDTVIQVLQLTSIADTLVTPRVQFESITTRFLLSLLTFRVKNLRTNCSTA